MSDSLLAGLAARKAELQAEQVVDLPVPQWTNPSLRLRVKPVEHTILQGIQFRAEKVKGTKAGEAQLNANAAILAAATTEVLFGEGDGEASFSLESPDLVEALDLPEKSHATAVVRALVLRDGDLVALATAAVRHSGYEELQETFAGE